MPRLLRLPSDVNIHLQNCGQAKTPLEDVYAINVNRKLDKNLLKEVSDTRPKTIWSRWLSTLCSLSTMFPRSHHVHVPPNVVSLAVVLRYIWAVYDFFSPSIAEQLAQIGHSRVPVYEDTKDNIIGLLLPRKLWNMNVEEGTPIRTLELVRFSTALF